MCFGVASFSITSNYEEFLKRLGKKHKGIQDEVKKTVKDTAPRILVSLYSTLDKKTTPSRSFTAFKTVDGKRTEPVTVKRGTVRRSLTKRGAENIFEVSDYEATVGSKNEVLVNFLEEGTRGHGRPGGGVLRFATHSGVVFTRFVKGIKPMRIFKSVQRTYKKAWPVLVRKATRKGLNK